MNDLLQAELSAFLGYEPHARVGYQTGNSRNGEFTTSLLPSYAIRDDYLEAMVIKLYQTGLTTREISDIVEKMYGHHYSPSTVSNLVNVCKKLDNIYGHL